MRRLVLFTLAVLICSACGLTGPDAVTPTLVSVQVLEGQAPCRGCPVSGSGRDVTPGADNVLTVKPNTVYTFRAVVRTSGDPNNCVYNVFHIGWDPPDRTFDCLPETKQELTIDRITGNLGVPTESAVVTLSLTEWIIATRTQLSTNEIRTYTVKLEPEPAPEPQPQ